MTTWDELGKQVGRPLRGEQEVPPHAEAQIRAHYRAVGIPYLIYNTYQTDSRLVFNLKGEDQLRVLSFRFDTPEWSDLINRFLRPFRPFQDMAELHGRHVMIFGNPPATAATVDDIRYALGAEWEKAQHLTDYPIQWPVVLHE
ncbi:hypothetical protein RGQ15_09545 [Paracoccus sp. MBLB3053]|uniref:Uncharacterized protein n=1 Tax=Paracoccus aurantius TaxID=3073814 RepID=A0ABU2HTE6_9RHOB|nr:hypothetical protein [Paracoccus sp. MBLB3053]MDS9467810.1 hypothetical protein [Paracoccus sp. MBLB3053]